MNGNIGHSRIGGASFRSNNCSKYNCLLPMTFKGNMTNNHYYHPGNRASWSKRMRPNGGNGANGNARNANRPGINRLGGPEKTLVELCSDEELEQRAYDFFAKLQLTYDSGDIPQYESMVNADYGNSPAQLDVSQPPSQNFKLFISGNYGPSQYGAEYVGQDYQIDAVQDEDGNNIGYTYKYGAKYLRTRESIPGGYKGGYQIAAQNSKNWTFEHGGEVKCEFENLTSSNARLKFRFEEKMWPNNSYNFETDFSPDILGNSSGILVININNQPATSDGYEHIVLEMYGEGDGSGVIKLKNIEIREYTNAATEVPRTFNTETILFVEAYGPATRKDGNQVFLYGYIHNWSGFYLQQENAMNIFPISFSNGGNIAFRYNNSENNEVKIRFRFDSDVNFFTDVFTVPPNSIGDGRINIPPSDKLYTGIHLFLTEQGRVTLTYTELTSDSRTLIFPNFNSQSINTKLSSAVFNFETTSGLPYRTNNEIQIYDENNAQIIADGEDNAGALRITLIKRDGQLISSRLSAHSTSNTPYVKIQKGWQTFINIRAKLPVAYNGTGDRISEFPLWAALSLLGSEFRAGIYWPNCGEIDIMENAYNRHQSNKFTTAIHSAGGSDYKTFELVDDLVNEFHNFGVIITAGTNNNENKIEILFEGRVIHTFRGNEENLGLFENQINGGDTKYYDIIFHIAVAGTFNEGEGADVDYDWKDLDESSRLNKILNDPPYNNWNGESEMIIKSVNVVMRKIERC